MGSEISSLCQESVQDVQWNRFSSKDLYIELTDPTYNPDKEICKKICQNCIKSQLLPLITQKAFEN